jgi:uncharacterized LabA/DUF88 family protein
LADYIGYHRHQGDQGPIDASGRRKVKGNMDIELAVDAWNAAERRSIVLFSGAKGFPPWSR